MVRATLDGRGAISAGSPDFLVGVTDLESAVVAGLPVLYAAGRGGGTLTRFSLGTGDAAASLTGSWGIPGSYLQIESTDLLFVPGFGITLAGLADGDLQGRSDTGAGLGNRFALDAGSFDLGLISAVALDPDGTGALAALRGGGLVQLGFDPSGQVTVSTPAALGAVGGQVACAVSWIRAGGIDYAVAALPESDQIALLRADGAGRLALVDVVGVAEGAWIDRPSATATLTGPDGAAYVVLAASGSGSLTVLEVRGNTLAPVDHVIDDLNTRFDDVTHLEAVQIAGQSFVVAAGSDQGVTVLSLLPGGRLLEVASFAASADTPLNGISALEVVPTASGARIFVATQGAPHLVEIAFDLPHAGGVQVGDATANALAGGGGDDVLSGGAGNDTLSGGAGNDVLSDGVGTDQLSGGAGADLFVLAADGAVDRILDFQRGTDRLSLQAPAPGLGMDDLQVVSRVWGAEIRLGTEVLHVYSADGQALSLADFAGGALSVSANISVDPDDYASSGPDTGPEGGSTLDPTLFFAKPNFALSTRAEPVIAPAGNAQTGSPGNDALTGGAGADILIGGGGFDTLTGGAGDDSLAGGTGGDALTGGAGHDVMTGGDGFDLIEGDDGDDQIWGGASPDRIFGGDGDDWIDAGANAGLTVDGVEGGPGSDTILGGVGFDLLIGGFGDDVLDGGPQADNLFGDHGADILYGNDGFDRLFGGDSDDLLSGGAGPDTHFGQGGDDRAWGGEGDDRFFGGLGNDYLVGEEGNDLIGGNAGFDTLIGGAGNDTLFGDFNADRFVFADGHGHDRVVGFDALNALEVLDIGGLSGFSVTSDILAQSVQVGRDVVITTGAASSITLVGVDLADLDGTDFLF